jgi:hypothetical protein
MARQTEEIPRVVISLAIDPELLAAVDAIAEAEQRSRVRQIGVMLSQAVEDWHRAHEAAGRRRH